MTDNAKYCCEEFKAEIDLDVIQPEKDGTYWVCDQTSCTALSGIKFCPFCGEKVAV